MGCVIAALFSYTSRCIDSRIHEDVTWHFKADVFDQHNVLLQNLCCILESKKVIPNDKTGT